MLYLERTGADFLIRRPRKHTGPSLGEKDLSSSLCENSFRGDGTRIYWRFGAPAFGNRLKLESVAKRGDGIGVSEGY